MHPVLFKETIKLQLFHQPEDIDQNTFLFTELWFLHILKKISSVFNIALDIQDSTVTNDMCLLWLIENLSERAFPDQWQVKTNEWFST